MLAIDVGSTKISCAVAQQTVHEQLMAPGWMAAQPTWRIVGHGMASYPLSMTALGDPAAMTQALVQALRAIQFEPLPDRAIISVSHPHLKHATVTTQLQLADQPVTIRARELTRLASKAVGEALGIDREALLVEPIGYAGNGFEGIRDPRGLMATGLVGTFHVVSIPLAAKRALVHALDEVGVEVDRLVYTMKALALGCEMAAASSTDTGPSSASRLLLIDIGGACTDLALVEQGFIRKAATLAWGGTALTEQLAKTCRLPLEQALAVSLEGLASQKPTVRQLVEEHLRTLREALHALLREEVPPDAVLVTGRGALLDGMVEWVETMTERPTELGRHSALQPLGDLGVQLAFVPVRGLLNLLQQPSRPLVAPSSTRLVDRILNRTRHLLVEYF